jgi:hypothetical protein
MTRQHVCVSPKLHQNEILPHRRSEILSRYIFQTDFRLKITEVD